MTVSRCARRSNPSALATSVGSVALNGFQRQPGRERFAVEDRPDLFRGNQPAGLSGNDAALVGREPQQALDPAAHRLARAQPVPALCVKADAALSGADGHFVADGQHQFLAQIEAAPLLRVGLLRRGGEQGEGVAQVFETFRRVILHHEQRPVPPLVFQRHADLGDARLIPPVLNKLKERELLALTFQNLGQPQPIHFKPVSHLYKFPTGDFQKWRFWPVGPAQSPVNAHRK